MRYAKKAGVFASSTSSGEVKLWSVGDDSKNCCLPLGKLNSKDWDGVKILRYLATQDSSVQRYVRAEFGAESKTDEECEGLVSAEGE